MSELESWALYIDEEGFAQHWDETTMKAFRGLNAMMEAICRIGMKVYPAEVERLFCHQFGDGFLITSDFHEEDLSRSVLIATVILRHMLAVDRVAKACLAEGNISDITGCYPKEVRDSCDRKDGWPVRLGAGLLTISPVLGKGLLETTKLGKKGPSGPLLLAGSTLRSRLPIDIAVTDIEDKLISLNWLKGEPKGLQDIQKRAELAVEPEADRIKRLTQYIKSNTTISNEWKESVDKYLLA